MIALYVWIAFFILVIVQLLRSVRIVPPRKAYIVERLGKYNRTLESGLHLLLPFFEKVTYIQDLKEESMNVPPQECFTLDNVRVEVDGVIYLTVTDPMKASYGITDFRFGTIQLAQTTMRSIVGILELDRTFEERELINKKIVSVLSEVADTWGVKVHRYEVRNIIPPESVRIAMERQMTAERERRALIAKSQGDMISRINNSEGIKTELINKSEGEKQKRINEAEGKAREIESIAIATAQALQKIGQAISMPGGESAVELQLTEQFLGKMRGLARKNASVILPIDISKIENVTESLKLMKSGKRP